MEVEEAVEACMKRWQNLPRTAWEGWAVKCVRKATATVGERKDTVRSDGEMARAILTAEKNEKSVQWKMSGTSIRIVPCSGLRPHPQQYLPSQPALKAQSESMKSSSAINSLQAAKALDLY